MGEVDSSEEILHDIEILGGRPRLESRCDVSTKPKEKY